MRGVALLAVSALLLSGCSDGKRGEKDDFEDVFGDSPQAASGKGLIRGLVLTPAIVPVQGAIVQLTNSALNQTTDEHGAFVFVDLEPGTYFLQVSKPGWNSLQQSVDVVADVQDPDIVRVTIDKLPGSEPRAFTLQADGYMACSVGTPRTYSSCAINQEENPEIYFDIEGVPTWIQTEVIWDSTQPSGDWLYIIQGFCSCDGGVPDLPPPDGDGSRFDETPEATSPYIANANTTFLQEWDVGNDPDVGQLVISVSSSGPEPERTNGSGVALNQGFSVYATFFYNFVPDPEWTFGADGPHPVPSGD